MSKEVELAAIKARHKDASEGKIAGSVAHAWQDVEILLASLQTMEEQNEKLKHDLSQTEHDRLRRTHVTLKEQRNHADRITKETQVLSDGYKKERDALKAKLDDVNIDRAGDIIGLETKLATVEAQNEKLRTLLEIAIEPGVFGDWMTGADPALRQSGLKRMCLQYGFGAVLSHVEWLWAEKHPDSAKTVAACVAVRRDFIAKAREALEVI